MRLKFVPAARCAALLIVFLLPVVRAQVFPGLYEPDGTPHQVHAPNPVTGQTIDVRDFGANPADDDFDDRPAIENALKAAIPGDELYFPAGVYNFNSTKPGHNSSHIVLKSGVNWRGEKMAATILKSGFGDLTIDRFLKMRGAHDIVITNFTITSHFTGKYSTDTDTNNPEAGGPKYVVSIEENGGAPSYNITVDSVTVENYRTHGVHLSNSHDVVVKNSTFHKATDVGGGGAGYGVSIQGNSQPDNDSKFNLVENSRFLGPYIRHGVLLQYATHNNAVRLNYCEDTRLDAIDLHGEDEYLNEIYGNEVRGVRTGAGVGIGNTGATHDQSGPFNYIHDNLFVDCREGIKVYLGSPDTRIENNIVAGSSVSNGKGFYILNGPRTILRGNRIFANTGASFTGIYLQQDGGTNGVGAGPPQDVRIIGNEIYDNPYGVRIFAGERIIYEDNDVHDNATGNFYAVSGVTFYKALDIAVIGDGRVETNPPGASFPENSLVELFAQPFANWRFDHWEGDLSGVENSATVIMDRSKNVTAVFFEDQSADEVNLFVTIIGQGRVFLNPPGGVYQRGVVVTLTALPDSGWKFAGWSGDFIGASAVDSLLLDRDKSMTASFTPIPTYTIATWINGSGHLLFDPPGGTYTEGATVIVTAVPKTGWVFKQWGGLLSGSQNPDTLVVAGPNAIMATFVRDTGVRTTAEVFAYQLAQNYPNPFNSATTMTFALAGDELVRLDIFDLRGSLVVTLVNDRLPRGEHTITWQAEDLSSGFYIARLVAGQFVATRRLLLVR